MSLKADLIRQYPSCICSQCRDSGCLVKLDEISNDHLVVSGTSFQHSHGYGEALCDFMVFDRASQNPIRLALLELTKGDVDTEDIDMVHGQLQNGALIADHMTRSVRVLVFNAYLAKGKGLSAMVPKILNKKKYFVRFRTFCERIQVIRCGSSLIFSS